MQPAGPLVNLSTMKAVRLILCLLLFVLGLALLGGFSTADSGLPLWWGMTIGGAFGMLIGLALGGNPRWKSWDFFSPEVPAEEEGD